MKALVLQHVPFEGLGCVEKWLNGNNIEIEYLRFYEEYTLPDLNLYQWIFIMGGPMSINDENQYKWLKDEKQFIKEAVQADKIILGICLGAQLIAAVMGEKVRKNKYNEIGWFDISFDKNSESTVLNELPEKMKVFHWHGETFGLPKKARLHASSEGCRNQIFSVDDRVFGFQCHLEFNDKSVENIINNCGNEIEVSKYVQEVNLIKNQSQLYIAKMNELLFSFLDNIKKNHALHGERV